MNQSFSGIPPDSWDDAKQARAVASDLAERILPELKRRLRHKPSAQATEHGSWAEIPFQFSDGDDFNQHPHFSVVLHDGFVRIQVTVPNRSRSHYWKRIRSLTRLEWSDVMHDIAADVNRTAVEGNRVYREPVLAALLYQRRYASQNDRHPYSDGHLIFDFDTLLPDNGNADHPAKANEAWFNAFTSLVSSRPPEANVEMAIEAGFPWHARNSVCHTPDLPDRMVDAALGLEHFVDRLLPPTITR